MRPFIFKIMKLKFIAPLMLLGIMAACQGGKQEANSEQSTETADTTLLEVNVGSKVPDDFYFVEYVNPRFAFRCESLRFSTRARLQPMATDAFSPTMSW